MIDLPLLPGNHHLGDLQAFRGMVDLAYGVLCLMHLTPQGVGVDRL
jgi:hypothetical protein